MGKFEHYNSKYRRLAGTALKCYENLVQRKIPKEEINAFHWSTEIYGPYVTYSQEKVEWAVYHAEGFDDWQKFRVSLKGLSTKEKLYCLATYWTSFMNGTDRQRLLVQIRCNNYLGALIRGGQLNSKLEVVR